MAALYSDSYLKSIAPEIVQDQINRATDLFNMQDDERSEHRRIVAGRLMVGYNQLRSQVEMGEREAPDMRDEGMTYHDYFKKVETELVTSALFEYLTIIESVIIYTAWGIRNQRLTDDLLRGYKQETMVDGLRDTAESRINKFEWCLVCAHLPKWSNLSELERYYDRLGENGSTSDYDST